MLVEPVLDLRLPIAALERAEHRWLPSTLLGQRVELTQRLQ